MHQQPLSVTPEQRCDTLAAALKEYRSMERPEYDETLHDIIGRVATVGSLGKTDLGALLLWKRIRIGAWAEELLSMPDGDVRKITATAVAAACNQELTVPEAARSARQALLKLPGATTADAFASAVIMVAAPDRMAIYDYRAHLGLWRVGLGLAEGTRLYCRYMALMELCREELLNHGPGKWTARNVDLALFTHGRHRGFPRPRPWR